MAGSVPRGAVAMLVTVFDAGLAIDIDAMVRQSAFARDRGATGIALFGLAGEGTKLTPDEKVAIASAVAEDIQGLPLIAAADALGTADAAALAARFAGVGVDHIMAMPPPSIGDPAGLATHYGAIVTESGLTCILQDAPAASHVNLTAAAIGAIVLAEPGVTAIKVEAPPIPMKVRRLRATLPAGVDLYGGRGGLTLLTELSLGAIGTMVGPAYLDLIAAVCDPTIDEESRIAAAARVLPLVSVAEGNDMYAQMQKRFLVDAGVIPSAAMRAPSGPVGDELQALWSRVMAASGAWIASQG